MSPHRREIVRPCKKRLGEPMKKRRLGREF